MFQTRTGVHFFAHYLFQIKDSHLCQWYIYFQIRKQKQQLRDIKAGKLIAPGQTLDEDEDLVDEAKYPVEEENIQVVDEVDPTDRKPVLFDENKGKNAHFQL